MPDSNRVPQKWPVGLHMIALLYLVGTAFVAFTEPNLVTTGIALILVVLVLGLYRRHNWARLITLAFAWLGIAIGILRLMSLISSSGKFQSPFPFFVIFSVELIALTLNSWIAYYFTRPDIAEFYGVSRKTVHVSAPCPYCEEPLRTAKAKQCPHCLMDWHDSSNPKRISA